MHIQTFYFNPYRECTYVLTDLGLPDNPSACIVIDAGMYSDAEQTRFQQYISDNHLTPVALLITHSHPDHVCGVEWLQSTYSLRPLHTIEDILVTAPVLLPLHIDVILTAGHYPDAVCYYFRDDKLLFTGDTLFCESVGRTDLPGADGTQLMASLKRLMEQVPDDVDVYPGHGIPTTIAHERQYNPYL